MILPQKGHLFGNLELMDDQLNTPFGDQANPIVTRVIVRTASTSTTEILRGGTTIFVHHPVNIYVSIGKIDKYICQHRQDR